MATGTVQWFDRFKGYGFIAPDEGGGDLFAHHESIDGTREVALSPDQKVEFDVQQGPKGLQAVNIRPF